MQTRFLTHIAAYDITEVRIMISYLLATPSLRMYEARSLLCDVMKITEQPRLFRSALLT
jgi:hypothetical protein